MLSQLVCLSPRKGLSKQFRVGLWLDRDKDCSQSCHASRKGESFCPLCVAKFRDLASSQLVRNLSQDKLFSFVDNSFPKQHTIHTHPFQFSRSPKLEKKKNPRENTDSDFVSDVAHFRERERERERERSHFSIVRIYNFSLFYPSHHAFILKRRLQPSPPTHILSISELLVVGTFGDPNHKS